MKALPIDQPADNIGTTEQDNVVEKARDDAVLDVGGGDIVACGNSTSETESPMKSQRGSSKVAGSTMASFVHPKEPTFDTTMQSKSITSSNLHFEKQLVLNMPRKEDFQNAATNTSKMSSSTAGNMQNQKDMISMKKSRGDHEYLSKSTPTTRETGLQPAANENTVLHAQQPAMRRQTAQNERRTVPGAQWVRPYSDNREDDDGDYDYDSPSISDTRTTTIAATNDIHGAANDITVRTAAVSPEELEAEYRQNHDVIDATVVEPSTLQQQKQKQYILISVVACLVVIFAVVVFTLRLSDNNQDEPGIALTEPTILSTISPRPTVAPTPNPTLSSSQMNLAEFLASASKEMYSHDGDNGDNNISSSLQVLHNPNSPQHQALLWLTTNVDDGDGGIEDFHLSRRDRLQYYAYASLYHSTDGNSWYDQFSWMDRTTHICNWDELEFSLNVCGNSGLTKLELVNNNLVGSIPVELALVSSLEYIELPSNSLTGTIPSYLFLGCPDMKVLILHQNSLDGSIPTTIGIASDLHNLDLGSNAMMAGTIPTEIGGLTVLKSLNLSNNIGMAGATIPTEIGRLTSLTTLGKSNDLTL